MNAAMRNANTAGSNAKHSHTAGHGDVWKFFHGDGSKQYTSAYDSVMEREFYSKEREINALTYRRKSYEDIVEMGNASEENRKANLENINRLIENTKKLIDYQGLQSSVNEMFAATGGLNDIIAGYDDVKNEINAKFVQPMARFKDDPTVTVPSCVILYGPTGTGKTTMLNGIVEQSKDYAYYMDLSSFARSSNFLSFLKDWLKEAQKRYINEHKRTIMLINDAEKIFAITEEDAEIMGVTLDGMARKMIEAYGSNYDCISEFKRLLDFISKEPRPAQGYEEGDKADLQAATTIFITTNYPHLIHPDLLSREGKATKIPVGVAKDKDLTDVLSFYLKKMSETIDSLKALKGNPDYENYINGLSNVPPDAKENLKKLIKSGDIDYFNIDYHHMPYGKLTERMNPNMTEGAYSNDDIKQICVEAFFDYLTKNPAEDEFGTSFYKAFKKTKRGLNPERLKKFNLINKMIRNEIPDIETLDELLEQKSLGLLSEKQNNIIKYHITRIETELQSLNEREIAAELSEEEKAKKAELLALKEKIEGKKSEEVKESDDFDY